MLFEDFINANRNRIKAIADRLKDFKIIGFPLRYEKASKNIIDWLENFSKAGLSNLELPLLTLEHIEYIKTDTLVQKIAELVEPLTNQENSYMAPLGETSESSHRIVSNFNQFENYFPDLSTLLNNVPDDITPTIILIDDFLNSGGQLISIFYALLGLPLPSGEPNDEIDFRTRLSEQQITTFKKAKIKLVFYLAFDEGMQKIESRCETELGLDIEIRRYVATNKNASIFGDPFDQESIFRNLRNTVNGASPFTGYATESLTEFYTLLQQIGYLLNSINKPQWTEEKKKERSLGYSNLARMIVTDYNIPTISITALWQSGTIIYNSKEIEWKALAPRREKRLSIGYSKGDEKNAAIDKLHFIDGDELTIDIEDGAKDFKGYKAIYSLLKLYRPNSQFKEISKKSISKRKIGYVVYQENDDVQRRVHYYLYLFEGISVVATYEELKKELPAIASQSKTFTILLPKERNQVQLSKRTQTVQERFKPLSIFYLDDFIREKCTPDDYFQRVQTKFLENKNFVTPTIKSEFYNEVHLESIKSWIVTTNEPIIVIKGVGGVGKTTLAEYVSDLFIKTKQRSKVIFIDSHEIIETLIRRERYNEDIDLYHLYEVDNDLRKEKHKLSKDQFMLNLDIGNLLIVIDGLDEVISRLPKFDVEDFLDSIFKFTEESGNGKVLISCRSYFWQTSKYTPSQITSIEVLPFNFDQTRQFFEKCFKHEVGKIKKALEIANRLVSNSSEDAKFYHPYVLDIIKNLIETDRDVQEEDFSLDSKLLDKSFKYDQIVYEVCYRERNRIIKGLSIDDQVNLFIELAVDHKGGHDLFKFGDWVQEVLKKPIDNSTIEGLKSHPFFLTADRILKFRYDFFTQYFKSSYLSNYIKSDGLYQSVDKDFVNILVEDCWHNSGTINDMKARIREWNDNDSIKILDLLEQIRNTEQLEKDVLRKAVSHLFYVALAIHHKFDINNINNNTKLLDTMFGKAGKIEGLSVINFNSKKENIRFDFRGLHFHDCYIDNFESFWLCPADTTTIFSDCTLYNLNFSEILKSSIPRENFRECNFNEEVDDFYRQKSIYIGNNPNLQIRNYLENFFKLFLTRGRIEPQSYEDNIRPFFNDLILELTEEQFLSFLKSRKVIDSYDEYGKKYIKIESTFRSDIKDFIRNGLMKSTINPLVRNLKIYSDELRKNGIKSK